MNKSRKTPEQLMTTSIEGVPVLGENWFQHSLDPRHRVPDEHHHPHYLSQGFTVSLDVGTPEDRQWFPAICHRFQR